MDRRRCPRSERVPKRAQGRYQRYWCEPYTPHSPLSFICLSMLLSRDCTHFGCIGKATSLSVLGGTPWEQESKAFRQPKGDDGAELENGDRNTDVKKEDANGADGKRRERMPEEKRRRTSRRAGNASATTNPSIGSITSSTPLKKTGSGRSLWSVPDEDGPRHQRMDGLLTPAKTPIHLGCFQVVGIRRVERRRSTRPWWRLRHQRQRDTRTVVPRPAAVREALPCRARTA
jgi:hypothetical protein